MKVSVVIPTYSPDKRMISRVIESLKNQSLSTCEWELVVVENGKKGELDLQQAVGWHIGANYLFLEEPGLTNARLAAFETTNADLVCLVDDDNELSPNYLASGVEILKRFPLMGAWGGRLNPEFSSTEVSQRARTLWSDPLESDCWASFPYRAAAPVGGGMFLRREVATSYANQLANDPVRKSLDRSGKGLSSAGDIDLAYCACDVGLGIGRFPDLELTHLIPESRCTDEYLDRLVEGFGFSETILQFVRGQKIDFPQCFIDRLVFRYKRMRSLKFSSRNRLCRERGIRKAFRELQVLQTTQ